MPTSTLEPLVVYMRARARLAALTAVSDRELLARFSATRDEEAFAELVRRHGSLVLGVCRRLLRHEQDAEDAFQATFLVLAKKAGAIGRPELLGNWLFGVARRAAGKARTRAARRQLCEQAVEDLAPGRTLAELAVAPEAPEPNDWGPLLDEEVSRLPSRYRVPFILCYLEGRSNDEAARRLGCPKGTIGSRLYWARQRLRTRLARRGLAPATRTPAETSSARAKSPNRTEGELPVFLPSTAVPAALVNAATKAAIQFATGGAVPAGVATLAQGVLRTMVATRLTTAALVTFTLLLAGAGSRFVLSAATPDDPPAQASNERNASTLDKKPRRPARSSSHEHGDSVTEKEVVTKSFSVGRTPRVIVDTDVGSIEVTGEERDAVDVAVTKQGHGHSKEEARANLQKLQVEMTGSGDTVRVTARRPEQKEHERSINAGASAVLRVPAGAALEIHSRFGGLQATGVTGEIHAETESGSIGVKGARNRLRVHSKFGGLALEGDSPAVDARTESGSISYHGKAGKLDLRSDFGGIEVRGESSELKAHSGSGSIRVHGARGPVDVRTQFGGIDVEGTGVGLTAETQSGSVHFAGSLTDGKHTLISHFGGVSVALPRDTGFRLDAETQFGGIHCGFKLDRDARSTKTHLIGTVGESPSVSLKLHTQSGSVNVEPAK